MEIIALIIIVAVIFIVAVVKRQVKKSKFSADTPLSEVDNRTDVLIFDTETTGIKNDDEVIEIGIIDTTGKERYHGLIMPEKSISREASAVHGWTKAKLKKAGAKPFMEHYPAIKKLFSDAILIGGYNVVFDARMIAQMCARYGVDIAENKHSFCVMKIYAEHRGVPGRHGNPKWHKLEAAMAYEGLKYEGKAHSAVADAKATLSLMRKVLANEATDCKT